MNTQIHSNSKINILFVYVLLLINVSCINKAQDEKEIVTLRKVHENGFLKEGYIKDSIKIGNWIWKDSITNEKLIEVFYTDTIIGGTKTNLSLKKYFDRKKLFLIEKVLNEEQIIGLKVMNPNLYHMNILNDNQYHEAGQGLYLFYCSKCHLSPKKVIGFINNIDSFSQSLKKNNSHKDINLNKEEVNQLFLYLKKLNRN
ncbi:MAG TPA: hypothetical protein VF677_15825 [Flavobacterium sp.]|jgi:hypothetical protein